ncbi:unnamed protein product [Mytilus coruscus]|uniref:Ig-like domain-containing protein n=1 Tax=Mytilus coruscus TaxID=42192 RepID=A0A6J8EXK4_MYTCO|nr:unnamed protein product [Mytilus coruscus]
MKFKGNQLQFVTKNIAAWCIRGLLAKPQEETLFNLFEVIKRLTQPSYTTEQLQGLIEDTSTAVVLLERDFPLTLQNITTHLQHHIPEGYEDYGPFFIRRLEDWMFRTRSELSSSVETKLHSDGGRKAQLLRHFYLHIVKKFKPDFVFIQIGKNGICDKLSASHTASEIVTSCYVVEGKLSSFICKMVMEKHNVRIVFVRGTPMGKKSNISVVLSDHRFITDFPSNRFKSFYLHVERAKCCGTHTTDVDTVEIMNIQYLTETNAAIQTQFKCNRHQITTSYLVYHTMNKRDRYILERHMENMNIIKGIKMFSVMTNCECFAFNRYVIPSLHLLDRKSKVQNSGEAVHHVKTIIKKIHGNIKLRETHSKNFIIRCSRSTKYVLLVIILLWYTAKANSADEVIQWKLMTKPVYFGRSVILECIILTEDKSAPMLWTKLPNGKTLAYNQNSRDNEKYAVTVEYHERKMVYNLTIKHFNSTDVNQVYKCDFGFHSYSGYLLLNENDFISEPSVKNMKNFSLDNRKLNGIVMIYNGYPKPFCSGKFEGEEISKFMNISIKNISIFYETKIELDYITDMCTGTVNVTCTYGNHKVLITQLIHACSASTKSSHTTIQIILTTLAGCMLMSFCLAVHCYRKWKQNRFPRPSAHLSSLLQPI